jgi:phosphoribosylglycinamide formyltransferase-1
MKPSAKNIVVLISGTGSNMLAIADAAHGEQWLAKFGAQIACVISSKPGAEGLVAAQALGLATHALDHSAFATREAFEEALMRVIDSYGPAVVVLAGFMRILTPAFVAHYAQRLINIHPSLLPAFPGLNTHQRAIDAGCKVAGATVHFVTSELDLGRILAQAVVPVLPEDSAAELSARVLSQEHLLLPQALRSLLQALTKSAKKNRRFCRVIEES